MQITFLNILESNIASKLKILCVQYTESGLYNESQLEYCKS